MPRRRIDGVNGSFVRVKICCVASREEAALAVSAGADAIGFVSDMPSGGRTIPDTRIRELAATCPPGVGRFLLTSLAEAGAIVKQAQYCGVDTIQLVDAVDPAVHREIKANLPNVKIVQVIHITDRSVAGHAEAYWDVADALLLDSGNPALAVKALGGTGRVHDWTISREIVRSSPLPVFLAGGLTAENVASAIETVRPFGVDVCSGVRSTNGLDPDRLARFMNNAQRAL